MKQLFAMEWKKARQFDRYLWIWFILLAIIPLLLYLKIGTVYLDDDFLPEQYLKTVQSISGMTPEESMEVLSEQILEEDMVYSPEKRIVLQEMEEIAGYGDYLDRVQSGGPGGLPGYQEKDYLSRLQEKYKKIYADLHGDQIAFTAGRGIALFLQTDIIDGVIALLLVLYVFRLITFEYEMNVTALLCSTKNGTSKIVRIKWLLGAILLSLSVIFVLAIKLIVYAQSYQFHAWHEMIQSIPGYQAVEKPLTVAAFLVLFFCSKVLGYLFLYTIFFFMAVTIRDSRLLFITGACAGGVSYYAMAGIRVSNRGGMISLLSPLRCIDQSRMLAGYQAVNLLGYPVWYQGLYAFLAGTFFLLVLSAIWKGRIRPSGFEKSNLICRRWVERKGAARKKNKDSIRGKEIGNKTWDRMRKFPFLFRNRRGKRSMLFWEIRKNLIMEKGWLLLMAATFCTVTFYQPPEDQIYESEDYYYREYIRGFAGAYSDTKLEEIREICQKLQWLSEDLEKNGDRYTETASSVAMDELEKQVPAQRILEYGEYLAEYPNTAFVYEKGYEMLLGANIPGSYLRFCDIVGILLMVALGSRLWGMEQWQGMEAISNSTKLGKQKLRKYKWILNGIFAVLIAGVAYIPWFFCVKQAFRLQEWQASAASLRNCSAFSGFRIGELVAISYLLRILYLFMVGALGKFIQRKLYSQILSVVATVVLAVIPLAFIM